MFNSALRRLANVPINSIEDVRSAFRELAMLVGAEQSIEHFGSLAVKHSSTKRNSPRGNSALIVEHYNDGTNRTPGSDTSSTEAHGLWVKHGTAAFAGDVFFDVPPQAVFRATATADWVDGSPPTVAATETDIGLGVVSIRLADTTTQDPNIRSGELVLFCKGTDGFYYALDSRLDGKIGDVKMWKGARADVPAGWRILDGTGGIWDMTALFPQGLDNSSLANYNATLGATGGAVNHQHTLTTTAASPGTSSNGAHTHSLSITADGAHDHGGATGGTAPGTDTQLSGTVYSDYATSSITTVSATTGITGTQAGATNITLNTNTFGAGAVVAVTGIVDPNHSHTITDPGHTHSITEPNSGSGHRHTLSAVSHSHTVNSHTHSITAASTHTHGSSTALSDGAHTHTVNSHTHAGPTDNADGRPPFKRIAFIERYS